MHLSSTYIGIRKKKICYQIDKDLLKEKIIYKKET